MALSQIVAPEGARADSIVAYAICFAQSEPLYLAGSRLGQFIGCSINAFSISIGAPQNLLTEVSPNYQ